MPILLGFASFWNVPGHTTLSSKGKIQYPQYPHIPQQSYTAKPSGTAAQFHSTFRSGNPDNPTSIASHITVHSNTIAMSLSQHHPKHPTHPATPGNINVSQCYPCLCSFAANSRSDVSSTSILYRKLLNSTWIFTAFSDITLLIYASFYLSQNPVRPGQKWQKKNSNRATLRYYSLLLIG